MSYLVSSSVEGQKHISYLDGWRGVAILLVLSAHFIGIEHNLGPLGVDFFFALSGLLMGRILFVDKVPLTTFYKNRIARIFPVFYLFIAVIFVSTLYNHYDFHGMDFIYTSLFLRTYLGATSIWDEMHIPFGHIWSLNVEEHSYIILSLISLFALGRSKSIATLAVSACACICVMFFGYYKFMYQDTLSPFFLRTECIGFAIFISTAVFLVLRHIHMNVSWPVPVICVIAAVIIKMTATHGAMKFIVPETLLAIAVNTLAHAPLWVRRALSNRVLVWFGVCSFSLYIWQQPFYMLVHNGDDAYVHFLGAVLAMCIGVLSFYGYEQPTRKWIRNMNTNKHKEDEAPVMLQSMARAA